MRHDEKGALHIDPFENVTAPALLEAPNVFVHVGGRPVNSHKFARWLRHEIHPHVRVPRHVWVVA